MTPTNEPSTEGTMAKLCLAFAVNEGPDWRDVMIKAREIDADITTLKAQLNRVIESSSIAESGRLNAEADVLRLREALDDIDGDWCEAYCPPEPEDGRDWVHEDTCDKVRRLLAQSILKDAPE